MNRRDFLKFLGIGTGTLYFDVGKNLWKLQDVPQFELIARDFSSPSYCIEEIQTTLLFKEVFDRVVKNLYADVNFFKEINISSNYLTSVSLRIDR
jgi:hypothetical protein